MIVHICSLKKSEREAKLKPPPPTKNKVRTSIVNISVPPKQSFGLYATDHMFFFGVCVCVYCFCFDSVRSYKIGLSDVQTKKRSVLNPRVPLIIMFSRETPRRCRVWSSHLTPYRRNGSKRPRFDCFPARRGTIAHLALRPPPTPTDTLQKRIYSAEFGLGKNSLLGAQTAPRPCRLSNTGRFYFSFCEKIKWKTD